MKPFNATISEININREARAIATSNLQRNNPNATGLEINKETLYLQAGASLEIYEGCKLISAKELKIKIFNSDVIIPKNALFTIGDDPKLEKLINCNVGVAENSKYILKNNPDIVEKTQTRQDFTLFKDTRIEIKKGTRMLLLNHKHYKHVSIYFELENNSLFYFEK